VKPRFQNFLSKLFNFFRYVSATEKYTGPMQCPNSNAVGYDCVAESTKLEAGRMSEKEMHVMLYRCSAKDAYV
jgi:hypothetical protein